MSLLNRFRAYLKNPHYLRIPVRRYCHSEPIAVPQAGWGSLEWVLARPLYRFKRFDLRQVPRSSRAAALDLQLRQWTPFADSGYHIAWMEGIALAFCWDDEFVGQVIAGQGLKPSRVRIIPETVLRPPPEAIGARLLASLQGYEGQIWTDGQLTHSRCWKDIPTQDDWLAFQRDAGCWPESQQQEAPVPQHLPLGDKPWVRTVGASGFIVENWRDEKLAYFALALLLLPPTAWQAARLHNYQLATEQLQAEYAALQQTAAPVAEARGQALQALARVQQLQAIDPYPGQLELLAWVAEKLIRGGDRLTEWDYQDGKLKFTLESAADIQSSSNMVSTLQLSGLFDNVHTQPGKTPKNITLEMDVVPLKSATLPGHA